MYFNRKLSLKEMIDHIYGRINVINRKDRPNFFIKELSLYFDYLKDLIKDLKSTQMESEIKKVQLFRKNLLEGISYYKNLFLQNLSLKSGIKMSDLKTLEKMEKKNEY